MIISPDISLKKNSTFGVRLPVVVVLSLIGAHYLNLSGMVFSESGYRFPLEVFLILCSSGLIILISNSFIYRRLDTVYPFSEDLRKRILVHLFAVTFSTGLVSSLIFILYAKIFSEYSSFQSYSFLLFICLFLSCSETLLLILIKVYDLQKVQRHGTNTASNTRLERKQELVVKSKKDILRLSLEQLALLYSSRGIVVVMDSEANKYISQYTSLNEIKEFLADEAFFRVNRQVALNRNTIANLENEANGRVRILLKSKFQEFGRPIHASRYKAKDLWKWYTTE